MLTNLDDFAALQHIDAIRMHHGRQAMRDQNRDYFPLARDFAHRATDLLFGERVE